MKLALEALERTLEMLEQADCSTGYCCCGSLIDGHGIGDGHGPVDGGDYYQSKAIQAARHAITALREALAEQPSRPYRPLQDNGSKYFGAWDKADQALNRMADNARELGLDYEPDGMHHNKPQKRPQNCGTGYCSCIECVMEPAQEPAPLRDAMVANLVREGINKHKARELADHFINLTNAQPAVPDALTLADKDSADYHEGWIDCRALMLERKP